jgi:hypothetical protein
MDTNLIPIIISIVISIIGYFLKETMSTLKEVQKMTIENRCEKAVELAANKVSVYWANYNDETEKTFANQLFKIFA